MIFKYLTLENSVGVMDDIEIVRAHQMCMIRNVNVNPDGSLIYAEPLDGSLIELIPEYVSEEKLLISEVSANSFYFDETRQRYLDLDTVSVNFYLDGTNKKNQYMYYIPGVPSSTVPFKVTGEYCIIGYTYYSINTVDGNVIDLSAGGTSFLDVTINNTNTQENLTMDVLINDINLEAYINNIGLDVPVIKVYMKKTYYPVGV